MQYDPGRFKDYFEHQMTYAAGFRRNVSRYGNAVALIDQPTGRQWTYAELGADAGSLDAFCLAHPGLADFKRPRAYRFVDEVPVTATGKKMHFKLAETAAADLAAGNFSAPAGPVFGTERTPAAEDR